jgi:hypothetical protein
LKQAIQKVGAHYCKFNPMKNLIFHLRFIAQHRAIFLFKVFLIKKEHLKGIKCTGVFYLGVGCNLKKNPAQFEN